jgi:hypothetical protein
MNIRSKFSRRSNGTMLGFMALFICMGSAAYAQVEPTAFYHRTTLGIGTCTPVAVPPKGKALVIRQVRLNVYQNTTPGAANNVLLYKGADCLIANIVADVNPPTVGLFVVPFDPGLGIPHGKKLFATQQGNVIAEVYVDGYKIPDSSLPAAPEEVAAAGASRNVGRH